MTVGELVDRLQDMPNDADVYIATFKKDGEALQDYDITHIWFDSDSHECVVETEESK